MSVHLVADHLRAARRVLFITGAGISADSGLPTYRGVGGLYEDRQIEGGLRIEQIVSGPMFAQNPELTWRYMAKIEAACRGREPNPAHTIIAELDTDTREVWVLTQNVDGFHQRAGSSRVIAIHGTINELFCPNDVCTYRRKAHDYTDIDIPPWCPTCDTIIRPDVVLFEEPLPTEALATLHQEMRRGFDLVFSVGTSSLFPYIVRPVLEAIEAGIPTVEINPSETTLSNVVQIRLEMGAAEAMQQIAAVL